MLSKCTFAVFAFLLLAVCVGSPYAQTTAKKKVAARVSKLMFAAFPAGMLDGVAQKEIDKGFELDPSLHAEFDPMIKQLRPNQ